MIKSITNLQSRIIFCRKNLDSLLWVKENLRCELTLYFILLCQAHDHQAWPSSRVKRRSPCQGVERWALHTNLWPRHPLWRLRSAPKLRRSTCKIPIWQIQIWAMNELWQNWWTLNLFGRKSMLQIYPPLRTDSVNTFLTPSHDTCRDASFFRWRTLEEGHTGLKQNLVRWGVI